MKTAPEIDFAALADVDFPGCMPAPVTDDDGLGVESRNARLTFLLGNDQYVAVSGDSRIVISKFVSTPTF